MYIENRLDGNTPEGWAQTLWQDPLAKLKLRVDPRWGYIRHHLSSSRGPILDAGCGRGDWVAFLARHGYQATGIDYSEEMTRFNRAHHPGGTFVSGRIQQMPLDDASFGSIISWGVIEHDEAGPQAALAEFRRVLHDGGRILVTVPVDNEAQRAASRTQFNGEGKFFQFFYTADELADQVRQAGFKILDKGYLGRPAPSLLWPTAYNAAGPVGRRVQQLMALAYSREAASNVHCLAERPTE